MLEHAVMVPMRDGEMGGWLAVPEGKLKGAVIAIM